MKNNEIIEKMRERIKMNEELSIEMARMEIENVFREEPNLKKAIDKKQGEDKNES